MSRKLLFSKILFCFLLIFSPVTSNWVKAEEMITTAGQTNLTSSDSQSELSKVFEFEGVELEVVEMENSSLQAEAIVQSLALQQNEEVSGEDPEQEQVHTQEGSIEAEAQVNSEMLKTNAIAFLDVPVNHWAFPNIQHLSGLEIIKGYQNEDGTASFRPDNKITRAQAAKMIIEALGEEQSVRTPHRFIDVPPDHWAAGYIEQVYQLGIFNGYENGKFGVNDSLKRSQFAKVLAEAWDLTYNGYSPGATIYRDVSTKYWAHDYIEKLFYNGISDGRGLSFYPEREITRAEFSAFLSRTIDEQYKVPVEEEAQIDGEPIATGIVTATTSLNVRQGPTDSSEILGKLQNGTDITIYGFEGFWAKIAYNGTVGYIHKSYVKLHSLDSLYPLKDRIIVIDAGHGAHDPGTAQHGYYEKDIVLKVAKKVTDKLKAAGADVIMTRETDKFLTLQERVDFTRSVYGEIFVSIHVNSAASSSAKGSETYYDTSRNANSAESKLLAYEIQRQLVSQAQMNDRKIKDAGFYVIKYNQIPAVLVELGFLSNSEDRSKLTSEEYLNKFAEAIYLGIRNYYLQ